MAATPAGELALSSAGPHIRRVVQRHLARGIARRFGVEMEYSGHRQHPPLTAPHVLNAVHAIAGGTLQASYLEFDATQPLHFLSNTPYVLSAGHTTLSGVPVSRDHVQHWYIERGGELLGHDYRLAARIIRGEPIAEAELRAYFQTHLQSTLHIAPREGRFFIPTRDSRQTRPSFGIDRTIAFGPGLGDLWVGEKHASGIRVANYEEAHALMKRVHRGELRLFDPLSKITASRLGEVTLHHELLVPRARRGAIDIVEEHSALELATGPMHWQEKQSLVDAWDYLRRHGAGGTTADAVLSLQPSVEVLDVRVIAQLLVNWHDDRSTIHQEVKPHPARVANDYIGPYNGDLIERIRPQIQAISRTRLRELILGEYRQEQARQQLDLNIVDTIVDAPKRPRVEFRIYDMHFDKGPDASLLVPIAHALSEVERAHQMVQNPGTVPH